MFVKYSNEAQYEVDVGLTFLFQLYLQSPEQAFTALNSAL
jgi:hypothetical protein